MSMNMKMSALEEENKTLRKEFKRLELQIKDLGYKFTRLTRRLNSNAHS